MRPPLLALVFAVASAPFPASAATPPPATAGSAAQKYYVTLAVSLDGDNAEQSARLIRAAVQNQFGSITNAPVPAPLKSGSFQTPTTRGTLRQNAVTTWEIEWTPDQKAAAEKFGAELTNGRLLIQPASAGQPFSQTPPRPSRYETPDMKLQAMAQEKLGFIPTSLLTGNGYAFDGAFGGVSQELSAVGSITGQDPRALVRDPGAAVALVRASPRFKATAAEPPAPFPTDRPGFKTDLPNDAAVMTAAQKYGVSPEVLRALMFASKGYTGGYQRQTGLAGVMGMGSATAKDYHIDRNDPAQSIDAGARLYQDLLKRFGGDMNRAVAAFSCGSGAVRQNGGIPRDCTAFVNDFQLAYQQGIPRALDGRSDPQRPRTKEGYWEPVAAPVQPPGLFKRLYTESIGALAAYVKGETHPNPDHLADLGNIRKVPASAVPVIQWAAEHIGHIDPELYQGLIWAEGGALAGTSSARAKGYAQITQSGSESCRGFSWRERSTNVDVNIACGAFTFAERQEALRAKGVDDPVLTLAMYNTRPINSKTGEPTWDLIAQRRRVPNFEETVLYVSRISRYKCELSGQRILDLQRHISPSMQETARAGWEQAAEWIQWERQRTRQAPLQLRPECAKL